MTKGACENQVLLVLTLVLFPVSVIRGQETAPSTSSNRSDVLLSVGGDVPRPLALTAAQLAQLPRWTVRATDSGGKESEFEGIPLIELLKAAGVKFGPALRGPALATYLVVEATDGYRAVFALPELDPECTDRVVLLADRRDGKALDVKEGPLRVVVPGEKRHSRWVRQVIALKLGRA
jgi:DMSO/TMAO reductase YedYZ molybdopterin-dependent catalytic subunit